MHRILPGEKTPLFSATSLPVIPKRTLITRGEMVASGLGLCVTLLLFKFCLTSVFT